MTSEVIYPHPNNDLKNLHHALVYDSSGAVALNTVVGEGSGGGGSGGTSNVNVVGGNIAVTNFPTTQSISGTIDIGDTNGLALDSSIHTLITAVQSTVNLDGTVWFDATVNPPVYYVRRETVNQGTGNITVDWFTPGGTPVTPPNVSVLQSVSNAQNLVTETKLFTAIASGAGYTSGQTLAHAYAINTQTVPVSIAYGFWMNLDEGTVLATSPTSGSYVSAMQEVTGNVAISNFPSDLATNTQAATNSSNIVSAINQANVGIDNVASVINTFASNNHSDLNTIDTSVNAVTSAVDTVNSNLVQLDTDVNNVTSAVNSFASDNHVDILAINSQLANANTTLNTIDTSIQATNTALTQVNLNLTTIDTSIQSTNTALDTIDTNIQATNTALDTIDTGINAVTTAVGSMSANNHADLGNVTANIQLTNTAVGNVVTKISALDGNVQLTTGAVDAFSSRNHTDLVNMDGNIRLTTSAVGNLNSTVNSFASDNHIDLVTIDTAVKATTTAVNTFAGVNHSDLTTIDTDIKATTTAIGTLNTTMGIPMQQTGGSVSVSNFPSTQPVSASSLPLPSGAATDTLQTTANDSLSSIDTKLPAQGQALAAASMPVVLPAAQVTALTPPTTVAVTQTTAANLNATVVGTGTLAVQNTAAVIGGNSVAVKVDGSAVTQPVSVATLPLPTGAATDALQTALNASITNGTQKTAIVQTFTYSANNSTNGNSTAYSMPNESTWSGTVEAAINQNYATVTVTSTRVVTISVYQYLDAAGTTLDVPVSTFVISANVPYALPIAILGNYFKLGVVNTSGATASLVVDTYFGPLPVEPSTLTQAGNKKVSVQEQLVTISTVNSSSAQLAAGTTFTGAWEAVLNTASVQVSAVCDQATTITVQQAQDLAGTKIVSSKVYTRAAGAPFAESLLVVGTYLRILVQNNGASSTTTLSAQTIYTPVMNQSPVGPDNSGNMPVGISQAVYGPTGTNAVFVGGTSQVQVTPTVTTGSAYTTGNVVGGLLTFANAVQGTVLSGVLESVTLAIKSTQTASFKLYLYSGFPNTTYTDKTAPAILVTDAFKLIDVISLSGGDTGLGPNLTLYVADNIGRSLVLGTTNLYGVLTVTGTPTFTLASDVIITVSILKD